MKSLCLCEPALRKYRVFFNFFILKKLRGRAKLPGRQPPRYFLRVTPAISIIRAFLTSNVVANAREAKTLYGFFFFRFVLIDTTSCVLMIRDEIDP